VIELKRAPEVPSGSLQQQDCPNFGVVQTAPTPKNSSSPNRPVIF